jgi:hypothetical protein
MTTNIIHVRPVCTLNDCKAYAAQRAAVVRHHVQTELAALQMSQPVSDLIYAPFICGFDNSYDDIYNILSQVSNAMIAAWDHFFEAERLRRELAELKGRPVETIECKVITEPLP